MRSHDTMEKLFILLYPFTIYIAIYLATYWWSMQVHATILVVVKFYPDFIIKALLYTTYLAGSSTIEFQWNTKMLSCSQLRTYQLCTVFYCIQCSIITALCVWMVPSTLSWLVDTAYAYDVRAGKCHYYVFILASMAGTLYWLHNITSVYIIVSSKTFHAT